MYHFSLKDSDDHHHRHHHHHRHRLHNMYFTTRCLIHPVPTASRITKQRRRQQWTSQLKKKQSANAYACWEGCSWWRTGQRSSSCLPVGSQKWVSTTNSAFFVNHSGRRFHVHDIPVGLIVLHQIITGSICLSEAPKADLESPCHHISQQQILRVASESCGPWRHDSLIYFQGGGGVLNLLMPLRRLSSIASSSREKVKVLLFRIWAVILSLS